MPIELRLYNNETKLGAGRVIPPEAVNFARDILAGVTVAEDVELFLSLLVREGRKALVELGQKKLVRASETAQGDSLRTFNVDADTRFPPEPSPVE